MENKFNDVSAWTKEIYDRTVAGEITEDELKEELILFYKAARGIQGFDGLFWGEKLELAHEMPRDVFCDLVAEPTHRVTALMMYGWFNYKSVRSFKPLKEALNRALIAATECRFRGHGYEADEVMEKNLEIYEKVKAYHFFRRYGDMNVEFTDMFVNYYGDLCLWRKIREDQM